MSIGWLITHILLNFHDASFFVFNVSDHIPLRSPDKSYIKYISAILIGIGFNVFNFTTDFSLISIFALPMIFAPYVFICLVGEWHYKAFWLSFVWTLLVACDILGSILPMFLHDVSLGFVLQNNTSRILAIVISRIFTTSSWIYLHKKREKIKYTSQETLKVLVTLCFFIAVASVFAASLEYETMDTSLLPVTLGLVFFTIFTFFISFGQREKQLKILLADEESALEQKKSNIMQSYQYEIIKSYKTVRKFQSELLTQIQSAWPSNREKLRNVEEYFLTISEMSHALKNEYETGNSLVDTVLLIKASEAFRNGIGMEVQGVLDDATSITAEDICIILDSILSEAVENVNIIQDQDVLKTILVFFSEHKHGLRIKIEYPTGSECKTDARNLVQEFIVRYSGTVNYSRQDYYCDIEVDLMFPGFISKISDLRKEVK